MTLQNAQYQGIAFTPDFGSSWSADDADDDEDSMDEITREYMSARQYNAELVKEIEILDRKLEEVSSRRRIAPHTESGSYGTDFESSTLRVKILEEQLIAARHLEQLRLDQLSKVMSVFERLKLPLSDKEWSETSLEMTEILTACPTLPALSKVDLKDIDNADHSEVSSISTEPDITNSPLLTRGVGLEITVTEMGYSHKRPHGEVLAMLERMIAKVDRTLHLVDKAQALEKSPPKFDRLSAWKPMLYASRSPERYKPCHHGRYAESLPISRWKLML